MKNNMINFEEIKKHKDKYKNLLYRFNHESLVNYNKYLINEDKEFKNIIDLNQELREISDSINYYLINPSKRLCFIQWKDKFNNTSNWELNDFIGYYLYLYKKTYGNEDKSFKEKIYLTISTKNLKGFYNDYFNNNPFKLRFFLDWYFTNLSAELSFIETTNFNKTVLSENTLKIYKDFNKEYLYSE